MYIHELCQAPFTYFLVLSGKKQVAAMILAVILSALAAVAKACGSGWSTVPLLTAATPH